MKVSQGLLGYNFVLFVTIASFIGCGILSGGLALYFFGGMRANFLDSVNVYQEFEYLGKACEIQGVSHVAESINGYAECGDGCTTDITVCEDTVVYNFTYNDLLLTSRTFVSYRNEIDGSGQGDRCTEDRENGIYGYEGYISDGVPFVCVGECEVGTMVECWELSDAQGYNQESWANCGNEECIKLVDPSIEHTDAVEEAETMSTFGEMLLTVGAILAVVPGLTYFLCCKPHLERQSDKFTLQDEYQSCSVELTGLDNDDLCTSYAPPTNMNDLDDVKTVMNSRVADAHHKIV